MTDFRMGTLGRKALFSGVASLALTVAAAAKDLPADADGAEEITNFVATYAGAAAASPPALVVKPEGDAYLVAVDIGALTQSLQPLGITYEPATITFKVYAQDDDAWRVELTDFPQIVSHRRDGDKSLDATTSISGFKSEFVIDPELGWIRSADASAQTTAVAVKGPGIDETIDLGALKASSTTTAGAAGAVSFAAHETLGPVGFKVAVDPASAAPKAGESSKPVDASGEAASGSIDIKSDGWTPKPILSVWAFAVAHPGRAELASNEAAFKALLWAALAGQPSVSENVEMKAFTVDVPQGAIKIAGGRFGVGIGVAGPASHFEEHFSATGLVLPESAAPPMFRDLIPTAFDIGFKLTGFDLNAAAKEAVADMHLAGDGPLIASQDNDKVIAKLTGAGPVVLEIPPSHITAPQLDIAFEGRGQYVVGGKPTGSFTVHMRDFDKTLTAVKALGPDAEKQMIPALAMAKGLAKTEADGALSWVGEVGADGVMKVNGLPLGKAPF